MRSLGQPVGSLAADLIGVSMITCKHRCTRGTNEMK